MDIEELVADVDENQISFDFLLDMVPDVREWTMDNTLVVIVRTKAEISPDFEICGKKLIDWVALASCGCQQKVIEEPSENDFLSVIKSLGEGFSYVVVLYSDTPLLKKSTFVEIMEYFSNHRMNVLKLSRGIVFRGEYLKNAKMIMSGMVEEFDKEDFEIIDNRQKASYAFKVLNRRILNYHKEAGVVLFGENTIFIDADVEIEPGVVIYPNNIIKGESYIGHDVILESGNYIIDTIVCDEAFVMQSYLEKSKVENGKIVGPFAKLINKKV